MIKEVMAENGDVLIAQLDELDEVFGCVIDEQPNSLIRCYNCFWEGCPMRGGKLKEGKEE